MENVLTKTHHFLSGKLTTIML